ncbi:MAG TPA: kelch-like protein [Gammaproteobacteria bacterium]|nr:kelch-like protein [Gammaproteobacteria bacterium]
MKRWFERALLILFCGLLLAACGKDVPPREWVPGWQQGPNTLVSRSGAAALEVNGVIHLIGGVDGRNFLASSEYARILPDGSLSEWQQGPSLNVERGFFTATVSGKFVYVAGGGRGPNGSIQLTSVERAEIRPDGTLGPWQLEKHEFNVKRRCSRLLVLGNHIYAFGGFGGILLDTVESAEILPDGSLDEWLVLDERMTVPRYISGSIAAEQRAYLIGGHDKVRGVGIRNVEWAHETADEPGFLDPWQPTAELVTGRYGLEVARHDDYLYAFGGLDGARYLDSVEKGRLKPGGGIESWTETTPMASPREGMNIIVKGDHVYVIGGGNLQGYPGSVEYAGFDAHGDIGFWTTPEAAKQHREAIAAREAARAVLPNEAVIVQNIQTASYSYLQVQRDDGAVAWLAGPRTELPKGSRIQFADGVFMSNFYSKELKRNFPAIMFIGEIRPVAAKDG